MSNSPTGICGIPKGRFCDRYPSPLQCRTPQRRPREDCLKQSKTKVQRRKELGHCNDSSIQNFQKSVKDRILAKHTDTEDEIVAQTIAKYGFRTLQCAMMACRHVPEKFLNRFNYLQTIIKQA